MKIIREILELKDLRR